MKEERMPGQFDAETKFAALEERVANLSTRFSSLESNMSRGFSQFETALAKLSTDISNAGKSNWGVLGTWAGVIVLIISILGGFAYFPIREKQADQRDDIRLIVEHHASDMRDLLARQAKLRDFMLDKMASIHDLDNLRGRGERDIANLQRQIDEVEKRLGDTYSARDALIDERNRIERLENLVREMKARP